ncbi:hypothetical protein TrVE_jg1883 [Triparma verrucosa]|nr:hypothetical protein TrVE_jg1883 [Triparma verrucosa]
MVDLNTMTVTPLGSGQEVGRSCHLLEFQGKKILLDCGIHPGYSGLDGLPNFDRIDPPSIDLLLITHFHLDHAASLPYFTERTGFRGRVFMTHPTKAVLRLLLQDYIRLMEIKSGTDDEESSVLYTEDELQSCIKKIELIDYHSVQSVSGIKFWAYNAGHVLGAAMFMLEISGRHVLYTGDYSMEDDRHLSAAEIPSISPDVLIIESTYGVQVHPTREEREARFTGTVDRVVSGGGRCLIPVFALGRAQELLLILDEYWQANPHLHEIPIWYASKLATKALRVYQTYVNMMNVRIRAAMDLGNPFQFKFIQNLKSINVDDFDDRGPGVVFASPGMLQSGVSRKLFDRWCTDPKNGVLIAGYAVENTMAKELMKEPEEVVSLEGKRQPLNCIVEYVSFSAHVDFVQNRDFMMKVKPGRIILVHGQRHEMKRLKQAMDTQYRKEFPASERPRIDMPENTQTIKMPFTQRKDAVVMGKLADGAERRKFKKGDELKGVMFTQNFQTSICDPEDLGTYTELRVGNVSSKLHVPFVGSLATLRLFLNELFVGVTEDPQTGVFSLHSSTLLITPTTSSKLILSWNASPVADMLADAAVALIMHSQTSAASIRITSKPCNHGIREGEEKEDNKKKKKEELSPRSARLKIVNRLLLDQFSRVEADYDGGKFTVTCEKTTPPPPPPEGAEEDKMDVEEKKTVECFVTVRFEEDGSGCSVRVECEEGEQGRLVQDSLKQLATAMQPIDL